MSEKARAAEDGTAALREAIKACRRSLAEAAKQITLARLATATGVCHQHLVNAQCSLARADIGLMELTDPEWKEKPA